MILVKVLYTEKANPYSALGSILLRINYLSLQNRKCMMVSTCHQIDFGVCGNYAILKTKHQDCPT